MERIDKLGTFKLRTFIHEKTSLRGRNGQEKWEKILATNTTDDGLIFRYKNNSHKSIEKDRLRHRIMDKRFELALGKISQ